MGGPPGAELEPGAMGGSATDCSVTYDACQSTAQVHRAGRV